MPEAAAHLPIMPPNNTMFDCGHFVFKTEGSTVKTSIPQNSSALASSEQQPDSQSVSVCINERQYEFLH